jgi:hypothetical protein
MSLKRGCGTLTKEYFCRQIEYNPHNYMIVSQVIEHEKTINELVMANKALEAFGTYYGEDVVMTQIDGYTSIGKAACQKLQEGFVSSVLEFRGRELLASVVTLSDLPEFEFVVIATWFNDYTVIRDGKHVITKGNQTSFTYWAGDKIRKVRFMSGSEIIA